MHASGDFFFHLYPLLTRNHGFVHVMWKIKGQVHWFLYRKSYQSLSSFVHVILKTMGCIYFEIWLNYQNNKLILWIIQSRDQMDRANVALIRARYAFQRVHRQQWIVWKWFVPVLQSQLPVVTYERSEFRRFHRPISSDASVLRTR